MKKRWIAFICVLVLSLNLIGCGKGEETTFTGMVVSGDGTVISLQQFDMDAVGERPEGGKIPEMPQDMEGFEMPEGFDAENFNPGNFAGSMPENFDPEQFDGSMPENFDPEKFADAMPKDGQRPEMPADGKMPSMEAFGDIEDAITIDIADAHISVEIDGGKASGSMSDITVGTFITVTLDKKGNATNVLVFSNSGFRFGGFGGGLGQGN